MRCNKPHWVLIPCGDHSSAKDRAGFSDQVEEVHKTAKTLQRERKVDRHPVSLWNGVELVATFASAQSAASFLDMKDKSQVLRYVNEGQHWRGMHLRLLGKRPVYEARKL